MSEERQLTEITDFADVLRQQELAGTPVVVGGHAVNLWASYFLSSGDSVLAEYLPFTSKDLDFVGTVDQLESLHRRFNGTKKIHLAKQGQITQRQVVNVLEEVREIVTSPMAVRSAEKWGFDFSAVWPVDELAGCGLEKIERFTRMRLGD